MPIKKAAKKAVRQAARRTVINQSAMKNIDYWIRKCRKAIGAKKKKDAQEFYKKAARALDKAAQKKIIKKNKANRLKSRLASQSAKI